MFVVSLQLIKKDFLANVVQNNKRGGSSGSGCGSGNSHEKFDTILRAHHSREEEIPSFLSFRCFYANKILCYEIEQCCHFYTDKNNDKNICFKFVRGWCFHASGRYGIVIANRTLGICIKIVSTKEVNTISIKSGKLQKFKKFKMEISDSFSIEHEIRMLKHFKAIKSNIIVGYKGEISLFFVFSTFVV